MNVCGHSQPQWRIRDWWNMLNDYISKVLAKRNQTDSKPFLRMKTETKRKRAVNSLEMWETILQSPVTERRSTHRGDSWERCHLKEIATCSTIRTESYCFPANHLDYIYNCRAQIAPKPQKMVTLKKNKKIHGIISPCWIISLFIDVEWKKNILL